MTPFETIDHITIGKTPWEKLSVGDRKSFSTFMVNRNLSMLSDQIDIVNYIQGYGRTTSIIPPANLYKMYLNILPGRKQYIKYIKKNTEKYNKDLLQILSEHYEVSKREAKSYIDKLVPEKIEHLLYSLGYDEKTIKKLMK